MHNTFRRRLIFIVLTSAVIWAFLWYTHSLVDRLTRSDKQNCETIARLWAGIQYPLSIVAGETGLITCSHCGNPVGISPENMAPYSRYCGFCSDTTRFISTVRMLPEEREAVMGYTRRLFADLSSRLEFSTIFADTTGYPQIVDGVVVDTLPGDRLAELRRVIEKMGETNEPVPIMIADETIGYLYYGDTSLREQMQVVPFMELGLLLLIAAVVYFLLRAEINREKDMSWVGFARETAHQISTPLSSLMGWIELLREEEEEDRRTTDEALSHMAADVKRLAQIAERYGQMGRSPKLVPIRINDVIQDTISYFNSRKGLLGHGVVLEASVACEDGLVLGNEVLLGWVLENLVKNAVAACASSPEGGRIEVRCTEAGGDRSELEIVVSDNGSGISYPDQGRIFSAGFTTRKGGWGLGLSLSRRIVEEHHGGSIRLLRSTPGQGTSFSLILPRAAGG